MRRTLLLLVTCWVGVACLSGSDAARRQRTQQPAAAGAVKNDKAARRQRTQQPAGAGAVKNDKVADVVENHKVAAEKPAPLRGLVRQVKGWGRDQNEAEADAVKRSADLLTDFLHRQKQPLEVTPSAAYVRNHLIHGETQRRQEFDQDIDKGPENIKMQCWSLTLAVTPEDYAELARRDQAVRLEHERSARLMLAVRILVGLLALLVAIVGCIRLEEWTRACCTRRLRCLRENLRAAKVKVLAVACLLIVVVMGLYFLA